MAELAGILVGDERKDRVIADCVQMIERYVADRGGLKGIGMRAGLAMLKKARPDTLPRALSWLLPELLEALEPFHREFLAHSHRPSFTAYLVRHEEAAARALLEVADEKVRVSRNAMIKSGYPHFRGDGLKEMRMVLPELGAVIDRHLATI